MQIRKHSLSLQHEKSGCSAVGSVLRSGRRGQEFESLHSDKVLIDIFIKPLNNSGFFVYNRSYCDIFGGTYFNFSP